MILLAHQSSPVTYGVSRDSFLVTIPHAAYAAQLNQQAYRSRQYGVDVGAFGKLSSESESKVYLFSVKSGDLDRRDWDGKPHMLLN
jgi:hypothetical protein